MTDPTDQITVFGLHPDHGAPIHRVVLSDGTLTVALLTLGCILQDVRLCGVAHSLTLGSANVDAYSGPMDMFGALMGPVANRISGGTAELNRRQYQFERNQDGHHTCHSGAVGTHRLIWDIGEHNPTAVTFEASLRDGMGGFPGNRVVAARFSLPRPGTLEMRVAVTTDAATWVNFANHSYWNLDGTERIDGHTLQVPADRYCVADETALVTGDVRPVADSFYDFRAGKELCSSEAPGLDTNFCVADQRGPLQPIARLSGQSGVTLTVQSTEPGVQIYDAAGSASGRFAGHSGAPYGPYCGLAIEPQGWPDAPNQRHFPSVVLQAGRAYEQVTQWVFAQEGA